MHLRTRQTPLFLSRWNLCDGSRWILLRFDDLCRTGSGVARDVHHSYGEKIARYVFSLAVLREGRGVWEERRGGQGRRVEMRLTSPSFLRSYSPAPFGLEGYYTKLASGDNVWFSSRPILSSCEGMDSMDLSFLRRTNLPFTSLRFVKSS